jgi:hypothetical protein
MSVCIGYYFNIRQPLHECAATLNRIIGCSFAPYEGDYTDFFCRFLGMEFTLVHNSLVSDRDLNFDDYAYFVDLRLPSPDQDLLVIATQTMTSVAYLLHVRADIHAGLLVWDVQKALAKYELRRNALYENQWFDAIANEFVMFPQHWLAVVSR